jgi:hypothetical protein
MVWAIGKVDSIAPCSAYLLSTDHRKPWNGTGVKRAVKRAPRFGVATTQRRAGRRVKGGIPARRKRVGRRPTADDP